MAIVAGLLAMVVAVGGALGGIGMVESLREEAEKSGQAPLIAKCAGEKPYLGVLGMMLSLPEGEEELQAMMDEMNSLNHPDAAPETEALVKADTTAWL